MRPILKNKAGKSGLVITITIAVLIAAAALVYMAFGGQSQQQIGGTGGQKVATAQGAISCPDSLAWAGTVDVVNKLNSTTTQTYDTTAYFYVANADGTKGPLKITVSDTTAGTAALTCGEAYFVEVVSTNGATGDSAEILSASEGTIQEDGTLLFTAKGAGNRITLNMNQRGQPSVRVKDMVTGDFMFDDGDTSATDYESLDGVVFMSSTDNATSYTVAESGKLSVTQYVQANLSVAEVNDLGVWILIDADPTVWDVDNAVAKIDGSAASDAQGSWNADEKNAYNSYELAYFVPASRAITSNNELEFEFKLNAQGGQNPTGAHNISIDYAPIGKYLSSKESNVLKVGAVDDSSSRSDVYTRFDTVIAVA